MSKAGKIGRNDPCPCGRRAKYKHCCGGKVDWEAIHRSGDSAAAIDHLSARGRNMLFLTRVFEALQLDSTRGLDLTKFKRAFTPSAVRSIYRAVEEMWPLDTDLEAVLKPREEQVSALYTGSYETQSLVKAVGRHCLYADKIQLMDPLPHPAFIRPEYSPLEYPEHYLETTLRYVRTWLWFSPWIIEGLVEFVRPPTDFDLQLKHEIYKAEQSRLDESPELQTLVRDFVDGMMESPEVKEMKESNLLLSAPEAYLRRTFKELFPEASEGDVERFLEGVRKRRESHPTYIPAVPDKDGNKAGMHMMTLGGSYLESRLTAGLAGSYLATDIPVRWRMIEQDRDYEKVDPQQWSPLAKAFGSRSIKFLENVALPDALRIRQEGRLESFRGWLRTVWRASEADHPYSEASAVQLAAELQGRLDEAEADWDKIDQDLLRWVSVDAVAGFGPALAVGSASWLASAAVAGAALLGLAHLQRRSFYKRFPGAFMLDLRRR
jgi:hypothetical protein